MIKRDVDFRNCNTSHRECLWIKYILTSTLIITLTCSCVWIHETLIQDLKNGILFTLIPFLRSLLLLHRTARHLTVFLNSRSTVLAKGEITFWWFKLDSCWISSYFQFLHWPSTWTPRVFQIVPQAIFSCIIGESTNVNNTSLRVNVWVTEKVDAIRS